MCIIATAKVRHDYNPYNVYFNVCLLFFPIPFLLYDDSEHLAFQHDFVFVGSLLLQFSKLNYDGYKILHLKA